MEIRRGDIFWVDLGPNPPGVQSDKRPAVVVQNDIANSSSGLVTIVVAVTKNVKKVYPVDVIITDEKSGLEIPSRIKCNQIFTIPKDELGNKMGHLSLEDMKRVDSALKISLGLSPL